MGILDVLQPYKSLFTLFIVIFGPTLLSRVLSYLRRPKTKRQGSLPRPLKLILGLNTVYLLSKLAYPPKDLFRGTPILTPNSTVRGLFPEILNPLDELLLTKLKSYDNRLNYARFGHAVVSECVWCVDTLDYWVYSTPLVLFPYAFQGLVIGFTGWEGVSGLGGRQRKAQWRMAFGWMLGIGCMLELGVRYFFELKVDRGDCLHLDATVYTLRQIFLAILPISYHLLPISSPAITPTTITPLLVNIQNTIRLTGLTKTAINRDQRFKSLTDLSIQAEIDQIKRAKSDTQVQEVIVLLGIDADHTRQNARRWITEGWRSLVRVGG